MQNSKTVITRLLFFYGVQQNNADGPGNDKDFVLLDDKQGKD